MEFEIIRTSKLTKYGEDTLRTTIPLDIIELFNLSDKLKESKRLLSSRVYKYKHFLILHNRDHTVDEIKDLVSFFNGEYIQRYDDIKVYVDKSREHYVMALDSRIVEFLDLNTDKPLSYAILEVDKDHKYLIISGDAKIIVKKKREKKEENKN